MRGKDVSSSNKHGRSGFSHAADVPELRRRRDLGGVPQQGAPFQAAPRQLARLARNHRALLHRHRRGAGTVDPLESSKTTRPARPRGSPDPLPSRGGAGVRPGDRLLRRPGADRTVAKVLLGAGVCLRGGRRGTDAANLNKGAPPCQFVTFNRLGERASAPEVEYVRP